MPNEGSGLLRSKEKRVEDAEKIRQDFIKSQRLNPVPRQKPTLKSNQDEH
jgi:hypothetical protein